LRIIAGRHRGRRIQVPAKGVRPTADRARQAVFNILEHGIAWPGFSDCRVLDLFAGTGAYGLEALSRGAVLASFVDVDSAALLGIRRNAAALGEARSIVLLKLDATRLPPPARIVKAPCALAFLDPPYDSGFAVPALQGAASHGWIQNGGIAVVEVGAREPLTPPPGYVLEDERIYGAARIVFLRFH
jgi:16S rRNA (guanine966-N2)-methyltransferase